MLEKWVYALVSRGYDIVGTRGSTARANSKNDQWNCNHPIPSLNLHFHALPEQKSKIPNIILSAYGTHGRMDSFYAMGFSGTKSNKYAGFTFAGTKETEFANLVDLDEFLSKLPDRNF